ncbi:MAG: hypothetical protein RL217_1999 [Pseudomonadota bacterium]|jgi:hypothetical protein
MRLRIYTLIFLMGLFSPWTVQANELDPRQEARLMATIMNENIPLEKRVVALKTLYSDLLVDGKIQRSFCVWDMLGKAGPVYATVEDQRFRSLHYGLELTLVPYTDEAKLLADLKNGRCDAGLISGARTLEFNRFTGSLEALGGLPNLLELQTMVQLLANPRMAKKMEEGDYVVMGVASLGENYLYTQSAAVLSLAQLKGKSLGVPLYDKSLEALAQSSEAKLDQRELLAVVDRFATGELDALLAPIVGFYIGASGKVRAQAGIVNLPLSQSTIQLVGRKARFPTGLAQILREDFLFKFESYAQRVATERANIPRSTWFNVDAAQQEALTNSLAQLRGALEKQGVYDAHMLALMQKVRCRVDNSRSECRGA